MGKESKLAMIMCKSSSSMRRMGRMRVEGRKGRKITRDVIKGHKIFR
jgi:hypothetical protein